MSTQNPIPPVTPKAAIDTIKKWQELIALVAVTLGSALTGLFGSNSKLQGRTLVRVELHKLKKICATAS